MLIELLTRLIRLPQAIQGFCNNVGITAPQCEQTIKPQLLSTIREMLASGKVRQLFVELSGLVTDFLFLGTQSTLLYVCVSADWQQAESIKKVL
jgi:hypothetical protein